MFSLDFSFGASTRSILSNLPGLNSAESSMSGLFVAPTIMTSLKSSSPSISARSWLRTRSVTFVPLSIPLLLARASISSKNTTHGATCLALSKIFLTPSSDFPTHMLNSEGPLTCMKFASDSVATALANRVFPVPGGP